MYERSCLCVCTVHVPFVLCDTHLILMLDGQGERGRLLMLPIVPKKRDE